ncbi:MAG: hypothetical protein VKO64_03160 [Candidatus Sericytochromatia bacterium]|nr:hypothetical protein [Candidatus Sericytochromatia bacterium]
MLVPIILIADTCSWTAVLTTNYQSNVGEESLRAATGTLFVVGLVASWRRTHAGARPFVTPAITLSVLYVLYMVTVDVPTYITRWHADTLAGKPHLDLAARWLDATRVVFTGRLEDWRDEMPWMSLYFSCAVWMSLAMVCLPRFPGQSPSSATPD